MGQAPYRQCVLWVPRFTSLDKAATSCQANALGVGLVPNTVDM
jgi:hypothetical protein